MHYYQYYYYCDSDPCDACPKGTICEKQVNPCQIPPCPVSFTCRDPDPCSVCPKGTLCRREPRFCINPPCGPDFVRCLDPDDVCSLEPETGPCRGGFRKFFYNSTTDQCELFIYGGCGGNDNQFDTRSECISACGEKKIIHPIDFNTVKYSTYLTVNINFRC